MAKDNKFIIELKNFHMGFSPTAHLNSLTEMGNQGHASAMQNVDVISNPDVLNQGPGLSNLTNGTQAGVVSELINFILDQAVASDVTYGIGATKLFKISSATVASGGSPSWPQTITNCTDGESLCYLKGNLYGFYNKSSGGEILKMPIATETIDPDWGSTVPTGAAALQSALHPSASKEDIMVFGNGRYLGTYIDATTTLAPTKLDFGNNAEVADVCFHANQWWICVNSGISGTNRNKSQIYLYDGSVVSSILNDETAVGLYKIGFIYPLNGIVYVCYQDLSYTGGYVIGYIAGRQIVPIKYFTGSLPTYAQKTLYKNTILFLSSGLVYSVGAIVPDLLPNQISQHADGGYATCGAIAAPFGTPIVASTDSGSNHRLAKFSGYDTACNWRSVVMPITQGKLKGQIDEIVVLTNNLGANAKCTLQLEYDQDTLDSGTAKNITGTGTQRHYLRNFGGAYNDFRVFIDWSGGNATNNAAIRSIFITGHYVEKLN